MDEETKKNIRINYRFLLTVFGIMLIGGTIAIVFFLRTNTLATQKITEAAEAKRPANLDITIITDKKCTDCFDVNSLLSQIKKQNTSVASEKSIDKESNEGKDLIKKFAIIRLPTFLVSGELNKDQKLADFFSQAGETIDNTFVFRQVGPPYSLTDTDVVKGRIKFYLLTDTSCDQCYDVTRHEAILQQFGITVPSTVLDVKSVAGRALVNKYNIRLIPTLVLTGEVGEYPSLKPVWEQVGAIASDGAYVFTKGVPLMGTYKDLRTNKIITPPVPTSTQQ
jgi:thiol-disulfide isomerase/thioredoxin